MGSRKRLNQNGLTTLVATFLWCIAASLAQACDTPVYRYAMYRWLPAPYEIYCFHEGELDEAGEQMRAAIDKAGESEQAPTNIVFMSVDLLKDTDLTSVPPDVKEAWKKQENPTLPCFLVSSPVGAHLSIGPLATADLPMMIGSPLRQQTGKLLEAGDAGVYLLLKGQDADANAAAEKVLRGVVDDVAAGKISLYSLPPARRATEDPDADEANAQDTEQGDLSVGLLTLTREDAEEKWLVDCLLALEPDLRDSKEPIVFMIYGRGRALFSCLGKGIHRDNLIQDVEFITGACSCTVKEQNPGVDLLMCYNWDAAARSLSEKYGTEEGSRFEFAGDALFPELIIPPEGQMLGAPATQPEMNETEMGSIAQVDASATDDTAVAPSDPPADELTAENATQEAGPEVATLTDDASSTHSAEAETPTSSLGAIVWVGAGLLGALIVLFGATFVVLRPR